MGRDEHFDRSRLLSIHVLIVMVLSLCLSGRLFAESRKVWIFFTDKGSQVLSKSTAQDVQISNRALERRARALPESRLLDEMDLPVFQGYLSRLSRRGIVPIVISRWLNAVSAEVAHERLPEIEAFPFVKEVRPVGSFEWRPPTESEMRSISKQFESHELDYGPSRDQNALMHVPELHDLGLSGKNIFIGLIDTGFNHTGRDVFQSLSIVAEHDFVQNDDTTSNQEGDSDQEQNHGTQVLSVIGGYLPGILIGPAYQADYALAKTENVSSETRVEEDAWVAGLEWLESLGCDIVSTSLGYNFFDDGFSYTYADLDGQHCVTTIAADIAARKGVVVVSSAGNERADSWHYVTSPADGFDVLAVGAVYPDGEITGFSSVGPTFDGRIKPDVMAMGSSVVVISSSRDSKFTHSFVSGTSFAAPLTAGVCALMLEAHPGLAQADIREAIKQTADRAANPDTLYGWGIVNAHDAVFYHGPILRDIQFASDESQNHTIFSLEAITSDGQPPARCFFYYRQANSEPYDSLEMSPVNSETPFRYRVELPSQLDLPKMLFYLTLHDETGRLIRSPYHAPDRVFTVSDTSSPFVIEFPETFVVHPVYPNPFNQAAHITFELPKAAFVKVTIINLLGQVVTVLIDRELTAGKKEISWDGKTHAGSNLASGVYFCRIETGIAHAIQKMVLVR